MASAHGVTQRCQGMMLSLFSRDVIALSACVDLSHDVFDEAILLGVCDKIAPGLLIGALANGHFPMVFTFQRGVDGAEAGASAQFAKHTYRIDQRDAEPEQAPAKD